VIGRSARGKAEFSISPRPRLTEDPPSLSAAMLRLKKRKKLGIRMGRNP
jgi:hypothetical protein